MVTEAARSRVQAGRQSFDERSMMDLSWTETSLTVYECFQRSARTGARMKAKENDERVDGLENGQTLTVGKQRDAVQRFSLRFVRMQDEHCDVSE